MTSFYKAIPAAAAVGLIAVAAPAYAADCAPATAPQFAPVPQYAPAPQWMPQVAQQPVYQAPPPPQFQVPPRPQFQAPQPPQFQPQQFQAPQPLQFQAPQQPQFQAPPRPAMAPPPSPGYGYPAYPYGAYDNDAWDNDTSFNNDWFGDWGSLFDGTGRIDMDWELDMKMDWEAEADADADTDTDFRGNSYYQGYEGYGPYGPWGPYQPAPMMPPMGPAPMPAPLPAAPAAPAPAAPATALSTDDDKDGVLNPGDFCPNTSAGTQVDAFGCTIDEAIVLRGVNFHTDSDKLTDESIAILDGVATTLLSHPELKLEVSGHTDSDGDDAYNKDLSQRRAEQVRKYLGDKGVKVESLTAKGYGEEKPIATNETSEGKAMNRRVELNRL